MVDPTHGSVEGAGGETQLGHARVAELPRQPQRPLDADAPVAKLMAAEDFAGEGLGHLGFRVGGLATATAFLCGLFVQRVGIDGGKAAEGANDGSDILLSHFIALGAEGFTHFAAQVHAINQLHLAFAFNGFFVRQHPHIGGDAGVVEHVGGQRDYGFEQIGFENVAADLRLARASPAGKQRRAIEDDANPPATLGAVAQLANQVQQEQQGTIANPWQPRAETAVEAFFNVFCADLLLNLLPVHAKRRVGEHVVKLGGV